MNNTETENTGKNINIPTSIAPWISVSDVAKAVGFYKFAFGATEVYRLETPDASLQVARLSVNGAEFWVSEETPEQDISENKTSARISVRMILTVSNPDYLFNQALKAGASEVFPVGEEHGWRSGRLVDPFGLHWEVARPVA